MFPDSLLNGRQTAKKAPAPIGAGVFFMNSWRKGQDTSLASLETMRGVASEIKMQAFLLHSAPTASEPTVRILSQKLKK